MGMASMAIERLERLAALPDDAEAREAAIRRQSSKNTLGLIGGLVGAVVGLQPVLSLGLMEGGLTALALLSMLGVLLGMWAGDFVALRRIAGQGDVRVAALQRRTLTDYLTRLELVAQGWATLTAVYTLLVGVVAVNLGGGDRRIGVSMLVCGGAGLLLCSVAPVLQRRVLRASRPALSESALRWDEAERAQMLRDVTIGVALTAWMLGGAFLGQQIFDLSDRLPVALRWAALPLIVIGYVLSLWAVYAQKDAKTWQRLRERA
ncbi:hypothetical protein OG394_01675 [Kribbella sp. NBC_01245]|uniref:hypothetical protein n=1 Tax=Kribbella sp. NBC_01245 TaxID=2903578 RepID=UPI002E2AAA2D|nr:hypothetical protein [Kribbella sp. NBC_01245]